MSDEKLDAAIEVTNAKSIPLIEDAFDAEYVSVPRNAWLSAVAVACFYRAEHTPTPDGPPAPECRRCLDDHRIWSTNDETGRWLLCPECSGPPPAAATERKAGERLPIGDRFVVGGGDSCDVWEATGADPVCLARDLKTEDAKFLAFGRARLWAMEAASVKLRAALELVLGDWTNVKARDAARAALGAGPGGGGNGWIAFADRKPGEQHERRFILVAGRGTDEAQTWYRCTAVYFPDGEVRDSHSNRLAPSHWMPLAEPPTT
jgi:hypothetical protein